MQFITPVFLLCLLLTTALPGQYAPPVRGPLLITGTFGELRSDHFHAGLDFRAAVGTPVYAVNDGYVSRVRVSGGGYGQAIYLDHPDGKRSVYGHLEELAPELLDTIRQLQYARETFEIDLSLDAAAFPVSKGQQIGKVGNRGYSFGPHLHFEVREAAGDVPLNPLSLGFAVPDTRLPALRELKLYELNGEGRITRATTYDLVAGELPDTVRVNAPAVAVSIKAYDRQNGMPNRNGIYRASMDVDSVERFSFVYDRIPYEKTEYLNALTDYPEWVDERSWYYLLYTRTPEAVFWPGGRPDRDGIVKLTVDRPVRLGVSAYDFAGNESREELVVVLDKSIAPASAPDPSFVYYLPAGERSIVDTAELRLELDSTALYEDLPFHFTRQADRSDGYLSDTYELHHERTPLHGRANLYLRPATPVPLALRAHAYIGKCGDNRTASSVGGSWQADGSMLTRIGRFGSYAMRLDTVAPEVKIERFRTDLRRAPGFSVLLEEESGGRLGYRGEVDGQWVLMEYDAKSGRLSHAFSGSTIGGNRMHRFELRVSDERGNERRFERSFRR